MQLKMNEISKTITEKEQLQKKTAQLMQAMNRQSLSRSEGGAKRNMVTGRKLSRSRVAPSDQMSTDSRQLEEEKRSNKQSSDGGS
jgi:hypothetical protein